MVRSAAGGRKNGQIVTTVRAKRDVRAPFTATVELIQRFHDEEPELRVGPFPPLRARIVCECNEIPDYTDETRLHEALVLRWKAGSRFPLPDMRGLVTVRPNGLKTEVRMEGVYEPPLGAAGRAFDWIAGRFIARLTVARLLNDIYAFIGRER